MGHAVPIPKEVEMTSPLRRIASALICGAAIVVCVGVPAIAAQGTGTIRGRVTDALTGRAVDGVQVFIAGTELGTLTNADGRYQFSVRAGPLELHTRRVGYASLTRRVSVTAGEATDADFELRQAALALDAVVVTGAGAQTEKRKLGNTVSTIDASTLRNAPVSSFSEQLAARDPAVSVLPSGGLAGVIQIFTKKGARGSPRWDFMTEQGFSSYPAARYVANAGWVMPDSLGTVRGASLVKGFHVPTAGELSAFYGRPLQPYQVIEQRFADQLFETGNNSTYSGSVSGRTPGVTYYLNGRYARPNGPLGGEKLGPAADIGHKAQGTASLEIFPVDRVKLHLAAQ